MGSQDPGLHRPIFQSLDPGERSVVGGVIGYLIGYQLFELIGSWGISGAQAVTRIASKGAKLRHP